MEQYMILMALPWLTVLFVESLMMASMVGFNPPRRFKKGHIREYDTSGEYVYKDQNPAFRRK